MCTHILYIDLTALRWGIIGGACTRAPLCFATAGTAVERMALVVLVPRGSDDVVITKCNLQLKVEFPCPQVCAQRQGFVWRPVDAL